MPKHANIFYIVMMLYGFGIFASIAFQTSESPNIARENAFTAVATSIQEVSNTVEKSGFEASSSPEVLIISPTVHPEKKI